MWWSWEDIQAFFSKSEMPTAEAAGPFDQLIGAAACAIIVTGISSIIHLIPTILGLLARILWILKHVTRFLYGFTLIFRRGDSSILIALPEDISNELTITHGQKARKFNCNDIDTDMIKEIFNLPFEPKYLEDDNRKVFSIAEVKKQRKSGKIFYIVGCKQEKPALCHHEEDIYIVGCQGQGQGQLCFCIVEWRGNGLNSMGFLWN